MAVRKKTKKKRTVYILENLNVLKLLNLQRILLYLYKFFSSILFAILILLSIYNLSEKCYNKAVPIRRKTDNKGKGFVKYV